MFKVAPLKPPGRWPLDLPLIKFSPDPNDVWTLADAVQGVVIMGENGSGKTSGSGQLIARKFLQHGFGGLVLCFKTDEAELWKGYLDKAGRGRDGRFFSVSAPHRFNFLDYETKGSGVDFIENVVNLLVDIASVQKRQEPTGSEATYWLPAKKKLLRNAIQLLMMAEQPIQLTLLYDMISTAPTDPRQAESADWREHSYVFNILEKANAKYASDPEFKFVTQYWMRECPRIPEKTRETIFSDFSGMFDPLTRGKIGQLFGTDTNLTPDDIFNGKVVVIDIPVAKYREVGQFAALIWAQLFQRAVDRRDYHAPEARPVFLWEDEAHYFTIDQDALFQTTARSKGISVVRLTQNVPNFLDAYGRDGKHKVDTLLGNHATKIFHRNGDPTTNEWAAKVISKELAYKHSISTSGSLQAAGGQNSNISVSEQLESACGEENFIGLRNGGKKNDYLVEGILFQSGRLWDRDKRWIVSTFGQRR